MKENEEKGASEPTLFERICLKLNSQNETESYAQLSSFNGSFPFDAMNNINNNNNNLTSSSNLEYTISSTTVSLLLKSSTTTSPTSASASSSISPDLLTIPYVIQLCRNIEDLNELKKQHLIEQQRYHLIKYAYPLILFFGLVGNLITFMVMCRIFKRKKTKTFQKFSFSLATLAMADLIVLLFGCFIEYLEEVYSISVRSHSIYSCKFISFACYLFSCYSAYLHGFIAVERWHAISNPLNSITKFTIKTNQFIIVLIFVVCLVFNLPLLWFPSIKPSIKLDKNTHLGIRIVEECDIAHDFILFLIDSLFYCLIPFLFTILFSILTLIKLLKLKSSESKSNDGSADGNRPSRRPIFNRNRRRPLNKQISAPPSTVNNSSAKSYLRTTEFSSSNFNYSLSSINANVDHLTNINGAGGTGSLRCNGGQMVKFYKIHSNGKGNASHSNVKLTLMLMALPISYLITTFPIFLIIINGCLLSKFKFLSTLAFLDKNNFSLAYSIGKIFMYINNSINILLYILFGKNLRKDFLAILPFKRFKYGKPNRFALSHHHDNMNLTFYYNRNSTKRTAMTY